jgi:hypothetical protein
MNFIQSTLFKLVARHALAFVGAWLIKTGILSAADQQTAWGAVLVFVAIGHSLWDKRALIIAEFQGLESTVIKNPLALTFAILLPVVVLTGCAGTQITTHESGYGAKGHIIVPVPGTQTSLIDGSLIIGWFKTTQNIQPTSTNRLYAPSIAVADISNGKESVAGGVGTNSSAGIAAGTRDRYMFISGDTIATDGTNATRLDGYNGFNPLTRTNN